MRTLRCLIALLVWAIPSFAGIRSSFGVDSASWTATDIVLAKPGTNGAFTVLEVWKGGLRTGDIVLVPELAPSDDAETISATVDGLYNQRTGTFREHLPKPTADTRMVLFLKKGSTPEASAFSAPSWLPANTFHDMKTSAVWFEGPNAYCFEHEMNPGPSLLSSCRITADKLRARVSEISQVQDRLNEAVRVPAGEQRASRLMPYLRSDIYPARLLAEQEIAKCGPGAVPAISAALDDPDYFMEAGELIKAKAQAGGAAVTDELVARLGRDVEFWRARAPALKRNWWNEDPRPESALRNHYDQTIELVRALRTLHAPSALGPVTALRDVWRSTDVLNDPSGINQMANECDDLIRQLQK